MHIWRISNFTDLSGTGGIYATGRWNRLGRKIIYCSDHPATCMLELLVRFDPKFTPNTYKLLKIKLSPKAKIEEARLPKNWQQRPETSQTIWEKFCTNNEAGILKVPSVIMPQAWHYLLNPEHKDHSAHDIFEVYDNVLDERFYL